MVQKSNTLAVFIIFIHLNIGTNTAGSIVTFLFFSELSKSLASHHVNIFCGGSNFGLLGIMGNAALSNGGKVTGILPEFFTSKLYFSDWYTYSSIY